jgi:PKD repeat protein
VPEEEQCADRAFSILARITSLRLELAMQLSILRLFILILVSSAAPAWATPSFNSNTPWNAVTTYQSIGLYWKPASGADSTKATVRFREQGQSAWREGHELWWDTRNDEYRGSLVELKPDTTYEVQLKIGAGAWSDTSASCSTAANSNCVIPATATCSSANRTQCTRTWNESYKIKEVRQVTSRTTQLVITDGGNETEGYIVYEGVDGNNTITLTEGSGHCVLVDAKFVVVRNLVLQNCGMDGIRMHSVHNPDNGTRRAASDIIIEDNEIKGFGRVRQGTNPPLALDQEAGISCNNWTENQYGGDVNNRVHRVVIQRNKIHSPRYSANPWKQFYAQARTHPEGANAVMFNRCGNNHVIRWNDVYSTNGKFFMDGLGGEDNLGGDSTSGGFPWADSDVYGNRITHVYDDAIETEGDNRNVRVWANYFDHIFVGLGNAAVAKGPIYVWRNVSNWMGNMYCTGCNPDTDDERGEMVKGGGKSLAAGAYNGGIAYYYHNTTLQPPPPSGTLPRGAGWGIHGAELLHNFVSRNNVWHIHKITDNPGLPDFWSIAGDCNETGASCAPPTPDNGPAVDFDLFNGRIANSGANPEINSVNLGWGAIGGDAAKVPTYLAGGGTYPSTSAIPSDANNWTADFRLSAGSLGTSGAVLLPNFNDLDGTRHVGAQASNKSEMRFGRAASTPPGPSAVLATMPTPATGTAPLDVEFDASGSNGGGGSIASLRLQFGHDGQEITWTDKSVKPRHTYPAGIYTATLTVTDNSVPAKTSTTTTEINATAPCTGTAPTARLAASPTSGSAPLTVEFDGSASTAVSPATIVSYSINYGDGTGSGTGAMQTHQYAGNGAFNAKLMVTDSNGCQSPSDPQNDTRTITVGVGGESITLQEGLNSYVGTTDTSGNSDQPGAGYGSHAEIAIGYDNDRFMNLIRFKIFVSEGGPVPDGATITSATLSLQKTSGQDGVVEAKRLLRDWHETQATWTNAATGTPWQVAGARGAADVAAAGDGNGAIPVGNGWFDVDVTDSVQAFATGTASNFGWRINHVSGPNSIKEYASRNYGTQSLRPKLTITFSGSGSGAATATMREGLNGYVGTSDTSGNQDQPGAGYGSHTEVSIGYDNSRFMNLVRFKIFGAEGGPVPDGATIVSATLALNKTDGLDGVVEAKRLLRDWHETQATWTDAAAGAPWQVAGALGSGDVVATGDGTATIPTANGWFNVDVTESVQAFAAGTANYGWRINHVSGPNSIKQYASRNHATAGLRPTLTVIYTTD